jgi:hypothetical protein
MVPTSSSDSNDISVVNCNSISETKQQVFWAGIARDNAILVQAGHIAGSKGSTITPQENYSSRNKRTPGFEYHTLEESPLQTKASAAADAPLQTKASATADAQE